MSLFGRNKNNEAHTAKINQAHTHALKNLARNIQGEGSIIHKYESNLKTDANKEFKQFNVVEKIFHSFRKDAHSAYNYIDVAIKHGHISSEEYERFEDKSRSAQKDLLSLRTRLGPEKQLGREIIELTARFLEELHRLKVPIIRHASHELQLLSDDEQKIAKYAQHLEENINAIATVLTKGIGIINQLQHNVHNNQLLQQFELIQQQLFTDIELFRKAIHDSKLIHQDSMERIKAIARDDKRLNQLVEKHLKDIRKEKHTIGSTRWEKDQVDSMSEEMKREFGISESEVRTGHFQDN
ncbi:hypothetical protein K9M74_04695 [Candidatus Woesearchaeota archaeon]|nr:hypothetical protein [Candidatus Woesearchaeota archaeon]